MAQTHMVRDAFRRSFILFSLIFFTPSLTSLAVSAQTFELLHSFSGGADGLNPTGNMARDAAGNLYGTTAAGGGSTACNEGCGVIFKLDLQGNETILHSFSGTDGSYPFGVIVDAAGNLYGATTFGGNSCVGFGTCGVVFKLDTSNMLTILHNFTGGMDGSNPESALIMDALGNLYGTTVAGGLGCTNQNPPGCGVIFKIDKNANETVLYRFDGVSGDNSSAGLLLSQGKLYGTTTDGGAFAPPVFDNMLPRGTVFELNTNGRESVLHSFSGLTPDGGVPYAQLIEDPSGNLYGTTEFHPPGSNIFGTVFRLNKAGGPMTELFTFNYVDGGYPEAGLTRDSAGNLYGTTIFDDNGFAPGNVFKLDAAGKFSILHAFDGKDGAYPQTVLVLDNQGNLYGTAGGGGAYGDGVVYRISP